MEDHSGEYYNYKNKQQASAIDFDSEDELRALQKNILNQIGMMMLCEQRKPSFTDEDILMKQYKIAALCEARLNLLISFNPKNITKNEASLYKILMDSYSHIYEQLKGRKLSVTTTYKNVDWENDPEAKELEHKIRTYDDLKKRVEDMERANAGRI
jgi:hypothetical protein